MKLLLDHGLHFIETDRNVPTNSWLFHLLWSRVWQPDGVALLLRRQGEGGLPVQNLDSCLHQAIYGSKHASQNEVIEVLILLIKGGANVYAENFEKETVSQIACCRTTSWSLYSHDYDDNRDLHLREIWIKALKACSYDAEAVISASVRVEELSDSDNDGISRQHKDSNAVASDCAERGDDSISDQCGRSDAAAGDFVGFERHSAVSTITWQPNPPPSSYETSILEGDAEIWRN